VARFLANENVPALAIERARAAGVELAAVREIAPGSDDEAVVQLSLTEDRVLVTFDKDFGELAFRHGKSASRGVILLRPRLQSPEFLAEFLVKVLSQRIDWEGHFSVAQEGRIRVTPMPK
jgi:predicted nuclease of predicted toxin-antitoxin system